MNPNALRCQLRCSYTYSFVLTLNITGAVWVALLVARGYSLWQVGAAEGVFHVVSLLAEVPSGMMADLLGRRRVLALSGVAAALSALLMAFEQNFFWVCASMALSALAYNLVSGTQEALVYDSLKEAGQSERFLTVETITTQVETAGAALGKLAGALTGVLGFTAFYLVDLGISLLRTVTAAGLYEPAATPEQQARRAAPLCTLLAELPASLRTHVAETVEFLRRSPRVVRYILAGAFIDLPAFLTLMYLQQRLTDIGLPTALLGVVLMVCEVGYPLGCWIGGRLQPRRLGWLYAICTAGCGLCTLAMGAAPLAGAVAGGAGFAMFGTIWSLHARKRLNDWFPSDRRATLISVDSMAYSLLMIPASPLTGWIGDLAGSAGAGLVVLGALLLTAGVVVGIRAVGRRQL
ncbi:MFS transporter [Gemmiger formicilis]|uniref:MFS transporter n=1 Tax=Gemmiger formicilis TaxID=745368 RepID=UPI00195CDE39|nr:MFS transporter [Gemmiger formicilis]MBM6717483.1 MFS transporter [Gemmiger formicilis]